MALARLEDVNKFLDESKVIVTDADEDFDQDSAERIIRSYLAGHVLASEIASWRSPSYTPEIIRDIAGRLVAAFRYRKLYSEDVNEISPYAQQLYDEAIGMLRQIVDGTLSIISLTDDEVVDIEEGSSFSRSMFYPNDDADGPKFGMGLTF